MGIGINNSNFEVELNNASYRVYLDYEWQEVRRHCHRCGKYNEELGSDEYPGKKVTDRVVFIKVDSIHDLETHEDIPIDSQLGRRILWHLKRDECRPICWKCRETEIDDFFDYAREDRAEAAERPLSEKDMDKIEKSGLAERPDPEEHWASQCL